MAHHKHAINISQTERVISVIGGGILTGMALRKPSAGSIALAAAGSELLRRGITGHSLLFEAAGVRTAPKGQGAGTTSVPYELGVRVDRSVTINKPRHEVYLFWRDLTNLPRFMKHVESVAVDGERSHWTVRAPAGRTVSWDAVIHNEIQDELLAWRTLPGAQVDHAGSVTFKDAPGGRGTELKIALQYNPPGGVISAVLSQLWGEEPTQQIEEDLRRLKQLLEAGEIISTEGQPKGAQRPAACDESSVQRASEASFPASDAPAYTL